MDKIDKIISICALVVVVSLSLLVKHYHDQVEYYEEALAKAEKDALVESVMLQRQIDTLKREYEDETRKKQNEIADLRKRISDGAVRVSIAGSQSMSNDASFGSAKTQCDIDGRIANAIIGLTQRGDEAIRELNQCIDQYNTVRGKVNK